MLTLERPRVERTDLPWPGRCPVSMIVSDGRLRTALFLLPVVDVAAAARQPLEFVCEWPTFGIAESRARIDAQLVLDAARRSVRLWPENEG